MCEKQLTTPEHFETFKRACRKWIDIFGLTEWEFYYEHDAEKDMYAQAICNAQDAIATMRFCKDWGLPSTRPLNDAEIEHDALHEVIHVVLASLEAGGRTRQFAEAEHERVVERTVHRIQHALAALIPTPLGGTNRMLFAHGPDNAGEI